MLSCPPERRSGPRFGLGGVQPRNRDPRCRRHWPWLSLGLFMCAVCSRFCAAYFFLSVPSRARRLRVGCFIKVGDRGDDGGRLGRHPGFRATFDAGQEDPAQIGLPSGLVLSHAPSLLRSSSSMSLCGRTRGTLLSCSLCRRPVVILATCKVWCMSVFRAGVIWTADLPKFLINTTNHQVQRQERLQFQVQRNVDGLVQSHSIQTVRNELIAYLAPDIVGDCCLPVSGNSGPVATTSSFLH
jgi:hypothetical protein